MKQLRLLAAAILIIVPGSVFAKPRAFEKNPSSKDASQEALLVELTGQDISKENDIGMYAQMVSAYDRDDEIAFKSRLQSMLTRFPHSPYVDNALFLAGRMAVDHKNYAEAIKYFAKIEKDYPRSNKVVAAKFAKAMTYKKMNLPDFAKRALKEVRAKYGGSPESFRADAELKLMK